MRRKLNLINVVIDDSNPTSVKRQDQLTKSFSELLCMDSYDLAEGYRRTNKIKQQALRNHARLIATVIIMTLRRYAPGFTSTETVTISWKRQKQEQPWKKFGVRRGNQTIQRVDWFLHNLMMHEGSDSIFRWLDSLNGWTIIEDTNEDSASDLEYDPREKRTTRTTDMPTQISKRKRRPKHQCNLL